jgi:hypothetical protein
LTALDAVADLIGVMRDRPLEQNRSAMLTLWSAKEVKYVTGGVDAWLAENYAAALRRR